MQPHTSAARDQAMRQHVQVQGAVQGVGFRPFVYTIAQELGLTGFVGNDSNGVFIEVEGPAPQLDSFLYRLQSSPPPLAHIKQITTTFIPTLGSTEFSIVVSDTSLNAATLISPDISICNDCLCELIDPTNRRYGYPFINCTNCGPRFTITKDIPYDRPLTTMADFVMCAACQAEYDDPSNRRFHAQPNACADCGPSIQWLVNKIHDSAGSQQEVAAEDVIEKVHQIIAEGGIVAVKGIGGFHLACDATNHEAVMKLRERKGRASKPFAIMVANIETARVVAHVNRQEEALLTSRQCPILLLDKRTDGLLSNAVAPGNNSIGVMLPYTPLHHLLFRMRPCGSTNPQSCSYLIMTSANLSGQPIIKDNAEALEKLASIADGFLLHDRDIHIHCDDSVVRLFRGTELPLRRSRGYAPFPVQLPFEVEPTLAVGGELKSTFCLASGDQAFMSQHIGDMENLETLDAFDKAVEHMQAIFRIEPASIVCDEHPGYLSTRWAEAAISGSGVNGPGVNESPARRSNNTIKRRLIQVQHHHAHIAAVMAENGLGRDEQVIGFAFDGTGYGQEATTGEESIWGGEILRVGYADFSRVAHLKTVPLPGGNAAILKPYRMALAHLWAAGVEWDEVLPSVTACSQAERAILRQQLERQINTVGTSSMGRLFDAVAALAGVRQTVSYEAQAAIEFESLARVSRASSVAALDMDDCYAFQLPQISAEAALEQPVSYSATPVIQSVVQDVRQGVSTEVIALRFHRAVANLIADMALSIREATTLNRVAHRVALSGGVFQNVLLLELATTALKANGFEVVTHRLVPPNDGGLALGQVVVANAKVQENNHEISGRIPRS